MKKIVALLLAAMMALSLVSFASAEEGKVLSLFLGGGTPCPWTPL